MTLQTQHTSEQSHPPLSAWDKFNIIINKNGFAKFNKELTNLGISTLPSSLPPLLLYASGMAFFSVWWRMNSCLHQTAKNNKNTSYPQVRHSPRNYTSWNDPKFFAPPFLILKNNLKFRFQLHIRSSKINKKKNHRTQRKHIKYKSPSKSTLTYRIDSFLKTQETK